MWVDIILLYLLPTRNMQHERQFLNICTSFSFLFHFKTLKNTREELFTFNFMQFAKPDSRGIQLLVVLIHFNITQIILFLIFFLNFYPLKLMSHILSFQRIN